MEAMAFRNRGFALVFILWVMVLITVIGVSFSYSLKIERQTTLSHTEQLQAEAAALSGINRAVLTLLAQSGKPDPHDSRLQLTIEDFKVTAIIKSPAAKIDINKAPLQMLIGLLDQFVPDPESQFLAAAIIDWRDQDSITSPNGAEADDYHLDGFGYKPANSPFKSISELGRVKGFSDNLVYRISPYVTIHSGTTKIDPLSAGETVLTALPGIDKVDAEAFIPMREAALAQQMSVDLGLLNAAASYLSPGYYQGLINIISTARSATGKNYRWEALVKIKQGQPQPEMVEWFAANE